MKEKKISAVQICFIALGVVINIVGGFIGLTFRLPIYMDSIGTILVASVIPEINPPSNAVTMPPHGPMTDATKIVPMLSI